MTGNAFSEESFPKDQSELRLKQLHSSKVALIPRERKSAATPPLLHFNGVSPTIHFSKMHKTNDLNGPLKSCP